MTVSMCVTKGATLLPALLLYRLTLKLNLSHAADIVDNPDYDDFYYWMAACSGWGVVTSLVTTLAFWAVFAVVRKFRELKKKKGTGTPM